MEPLGEGRTGCGRRTGRGTLSGRERPDRRWLLADGVGERQRRPAALVYPDGARWRIHQRTVRRLRQPLYGPARADDLLSTDPVGAMAHQCHRNAHHGKVSRRRATAGGDPPGSGAGLRLPPRCGVGIAGGSGRRRRPHRPDARTHRLCAVAARLPGGCRAGVLDGQQNRRHRGVATRCGGLDLDRAALSAGAESAVVAVVDQRGGDRRSAGPSGVLRRREDGVRQRPGPSAVGAQRRGRQPEMVCAAGISASDPAVGGSGRAGHRRRRPGNPAGRAARCR